MDAVLERFVEQAPVAVMARLGLQRAIGADWVNEVFEQHSETQYTRELLFSTVVDLMSLVALGLRPSLHAAAQKMRKDLPVSITALYDKVNRVEPNVVQVLVRGSAERLAPVMAPLRQGDTPWLRGWRVRVVDGNHLPASEKRLAPLRGFRGAALPGHSLVVFDPDAGVVIDLVPCEDGHASERGLLAPLLAASQPRELWIGDRLFCTRAAILSTHRRSAVLFRESAVNPHPTPRGRRRRIGRIETGVVYEQPVTIPTEDGAGELELRRIEVVLDTPTTDGETVIRLLTTLPKTVRARAVARLYRKRWTVESLFGRAGGSTAERNPHVGLPTGGAVRVWSRHHRVQRAGCHRGRGRFSARPAGVWDRGVDVLRSGRCSNGLSGNADRDRCTGLAGIRRPIAYSSGAHTARDCRAC